MRGGDQETLIDRIYEAAVLPELWPEVLGGLAAAGDSSGMIIFASGDRGVRLVSSDAHLHAAASDYFEIFATDAERTRRLFGHGRSGFITDFDVFTPEEVEAQPTHRDFLIPRGYGRGIATVIPMPTGDEVIFHGEAPYSRAPYDPAAVQRLDDLRPHIARASLMSARLAFERAAGAVDTLARVGLAAGVVTSAGVLRVANADFERDRDCWTTGAGGRIVLRDRGADALLKSLLAAPADDGAVRSIPLATESGPAVVHVLPVRGGARDFFADQSQILVVTRPRAAGSMNGSLLQALFDLTPAEADLAGRLADGHALADVAMASGKSVETLRTHLKRIMGKTGVNRQADLSVLLRSLVPDWARRR